MSTILETPSPATVVSRDPAADRVVADRVVVDLAPDLRAVPTHRTLAVVCTLVCFAPLGVAAVVQAGHVETRLALGDLAGARRASRAARRLCWASMLASLCFVAVMALLADPYSSVH